MLQKYYEYEAALQKAPQVGSLPDPELSMGVFLSPMELVSGRQVADIRLMQMFPWFGVLKNARDEMSLMANAKYELFRDAKSQISFDVRSTWYELCKTRQKIRISEKNMEILRTLERLSLVKFKTSTFGNPPVSASSGIMANTVTRSSSQGSPGMNSMGNNPGSNPASLLTGAIPSVGNPPSAMQGSSMEGTSGESGLAGLYRIQIEAGDLGNRIALLKDQSNTLVAKFNSYLNRPPETIVSMPDTLKPEVLNISFLTVYDSILSNNPMLAMLQYEQQSLDARKNMVSRMSYPMVGIGVNYSLIRKNAMSASSMNGADMVMPMVTVTLPVYRKKYKAMEEENDLMKSAVRQGYEATSNALQNEYYEALQLYKDAGRKMELYKQQTLLAQKSLDIMIAGFSASGTDLSDLLRIRQQTLDYETEQVEALASYNTAIAWFDRLMSSIKIK